MSLSNELLTQIESEIKRFFPKGSHNFEHTKRVYNLCLYIGKKEKADLDVLKLASLLHDIGRKYEDRSKGKVCHAIKGANIARKILIRYKIDKETIEKVIECIEAHRTRGKKRPKTKEGRVLFDADKLDSIGAVGIGRAFLFAGSVGAKLHNKDVDIEKTKEYSEEDTAYREFVVKLRKIKDMIYTKEGKKLAKGRHEFMVAFFDRLNKEVEGEL